MATTVEEADRIAAEAQERSKLHEAKGRAMVSMRIQALLGEAAILGVHYGQTHEDFIAAATQSYSVTKSKYDQEIACFYGESEFKIAG